MRHAPFHSVCACALVFSLSACGPLWPGGCFDCPDWPTTDGADASGAETLDAPTTSPETSETIPGACPLVLTYVAADPEKQRPWVRATHAGCTQAQIQAQLASVYLYEASTGSYSLPGQIPIGPGYVLPYTDTCVVWLWAVSAKAPNWIITRTKSVDIASVVMAWTEVPEYEPGTMRGVQRENADSAWTLAPKGSEATPTCQD